MKNNKLTYHLLFWLLAYASWIFIFRSSTLVITQNATIQFCYLIFIAANYYLNTLYNIPYLLNKKKYLAFAACFLAGILVTALVRVPVSMFVYSYVFKISNAPFNFLTIFLNSFVNILFWVVVIVAVKMVTDRIRSQLYIEQIEKEKATNELNFLRAQFNPHFLFNSINSIYAHIDRSNKDARDMLLVFSEMLRYQLYECNVEQIELAREINFIRNYIAMQKSRMDERVLVSFSADDVNGNIRVAPLLLITFIENAFKYVGFNEHKDNVVEIQLQHKNDQLLFTVMNTKDSFINPPERSSGLGIANARRRLELLYPNKHELHIDEQDDQYKITLTLHGV